MTHRAYNKGHINTTKQDRSREFINLLATICADGIYLPPALIYQGKSGDLQDTQVDELEDSDKAYFASSQNRQSSDKFGLNYLKYIFDLYTRAKAGRTQRLLIVDSYSSHVNWEFIQTYDRL